MTNHSLLAPIPADHLEEAIQISQDKEFVLFGSEAFDVLEKTPVGAKLLIYVSHDDAEPVVRIGGTYEGYEGNPVEMRRLEREGYRPPSTHGEKWALYWKAAGLEVLEQPVPLGEIQLPSGKYLEAYPRGPLLVLN